MIKENLTICFFGIYDPEYSRNKVLISGLKQNGVEVIKCHSDKKGILKYFDLTRKHWKIRKDYDVLFVAFPGFQAMILARFLTHKKIIFDCFAPLYESEVLDRQNTKQGSFKAKYYWWLDKMSAKLADVVLLDTNEHIKYFVEEFKIKKEKFRRIFIGVDNFFLRPNSKKTKNNQFVVHFHGTNIPLQGIEYILKTTFLLKKHLDIKFVFVGPNIVEDNRYSFSNTNNVEFLGKVGYFKIPDFIDNADICLGIFGDTIKTKRVIPNKVFECVARRRVIITADTSAIRELFDENDLYLISSASPNALAEAILFLKNNPDKLEKLAQNGYNKVVQNLTPTILGAKLKDIIQSLA